MLASTTASNALALALHTVTTACDGGTLIEWDRGSLLITDAPRATLTMCAWHAFSYAFTHLPDDAIVPMLRVAWSMPHQVFGYLAVLLLQLLMTSLLWQRPTERASKGRAPEPAGGGGEAACTGTGDTPQAAPVSRHASMPGHLRAIVYTTTCAVMALAMPRAARGGIATGYIGGMALRDAHCVFTQRFGLDPASPTVSLLSTPMWRRVVRSGIRIFGAMACLAAGSAAVGAATHAWPNKHPLPDLVATIVGLVIVAGVLFAQGPRELLSTPWLVRTGGATVALYLLHLPLLFSVSSWMMLFLYVCVPRAGTFALASPRPCHCIPYRVAASLTAPTGATAL